jgi:hypothetical protein
LLDTGKKPAHGRLREARHKLIQPGDVRIVEEYYLIPPGSEHAVYPGDAIVKEFHDSPLFICRRSGHV